MFLPTFRLRSISFMAFFGTLCLCLGSCGKKTAPRLAQALEEAKENKNELLKVLSRYGSDPKDSLKYRAAVFLIENMPGHHFYEGEYITKYNDYFKALRHSAKSPDAILDSMANGYMPKTEEKIIRYDIHVIDSAFLCENIDLAFDAWERFPHSKNYDFDDFCAYILPYRTENEQLTSWRSYFYNEYKHLVDSLKTNDPIAVASLLRDSIVHAVGEPRFTMKRPTGYPSPDPLTAGFLSGSCDDLSQFAIALFRTFGIASCRDFMPVRGNDNVGHTWVVLMNHRGEYYYTDFFAPVAFVSASSPNRSEPKAKVYRRTYAKHREKPDIPREKPAKTDASLLDKGHRLVDVTPLYANSLSHLSFRESDLNKVGKFPETAFLCALSWQEWKPVAWEKVKNDRSISFQNVDAGAPLRIGYDDGGVLKFLTPPFLVHEQKRIPVFYGGDAEMERITLFSKYDIGREWGFRARMAGGCFEGSDNARFRDSDTLHVIKEWPSRLFTEAVVDNPKKHKYVRYKGAPGSHCNVAEVAFFSGNARLTGKIIGEEEPDNNGHAYTAAMDGLIETSYDHPTADEGWVGLGLDTPAAITKIVYAPRSHGNYIKPNEEYELFMDTENGWKSLGRTRAGADSLLFQNVPKNSLLYLKNHSGGIEERAFVMREGKQEFK